MLARKLHRWIGVTAAILFLSVAITGVVLQIQKIFGEDEALREQLQGMKSPLSLTGLKSLDAAALDTARRAVLQRYGDLPVAAVDWRIKAPIPAFVFHLDGKEALKVSVNAESGAILSAEPDEESWLLKLHTGEIIGDGGKVLGLVWGIALVVMTITGFLVYLKIYKNRRLGPAKSATGWRRYFWVVLVSLLVAPLQKAHAGSPFLTDDPGFIPSGWEYKLASSYEKTNGGNALFVPIVDLNYTVVEHFKFNLTLAGKRFKPNGGTSEYGLADTDFKFKWRFQDEDENGARPAISIAPNLTFATASKDKGLGDQIPRLRVPIQFGKTWGKWYGFAELGYQFALKSGASDVLNYGAGAQVALSDKWSIGAELFGTAPIDDSSNWGLITNFGAAYQATKALQIQGSIGRTLRSSERGGSDPLVQVFLQWQFP